MGQQFLDLLSSLFYADTNLAKITVKNSIADR